MTTSRTFDVLVLGGGMVGVSTALHLQAKGRAVALIDRRGLAEETSYGNAGLIQIEGVVPYPFPRDLKKILTYALNGTSEANVHYSALPRIAPWLWKYYRASTPEGMARTAAGAKPIVTAALREHEALMGPAGILGMLRRTGYLRVYRDGQKLEAAIAKEKADRDAYGVNFEVKDAAAVKAMEPHLSETFAGAIFMPDPVSVGDPGGVGKAYGALFEKQGGAVLRGEARTLEETADGWRVATERGDVSAREVVVCLGPWSDDVVRKFGFRVPLGVKRGYHMHYSAHGNATLARSVLDTDNGYVLAPMTMGFRITTGAEFGLREAPKTPVQLEKVEPHARRMFPLKDRLEAEPWLGRRPCLPDMLPAIGPVPGKRGLWCNFGHHHLGFTLGPATGRLVSEMMTGGQTFVDPAPYRPDRFA